MDKNEKLKADAEKAYRVLTANREERFNNLERCGTSEFGYWYSFDMFMDGYSIGIEVSLFRVRDGMVPNIHFSPFVEYMKADPCVAIDEVSYCVQRLRKAFDGNIHFSFGSFTSLLINQQD